MTTLQLERVSFNHPDTQLPALNAVTLTVRSGECLGVAGENGAGKSTLLRHLNGLLRPTRGRVLLDGTDSRGMSVGQLARSVGLMFQDPDLQIFSRMVCDEVAVGPRNLGLRGRPLNALVAEVLARVGLSHLSGSNTFDLSYPQRKLLGLAAVIAMETPIVALDEPVGGQDLPGVQRVRTVVQRLLAEQRGVVLVSHDMEFLGEICHTIVVLHRGRIVSQGGPLEVFAEAAWPGLRAAGIEPPHAARVGARLRLGSTPSDAALVDRLRALGESGGARQPI